MIEREKKPRESGEEDIGLPQVLQFSSTGSNLNDGHCGADDSCACSASTDRAPPQLSAAKAQLISIRALLLSVPCGNSSCEPTRQTHNYRTSCIPCVMNEILGRQRDREEKRGPS